MNAEQPGTYGPRERLIDSARVCIARRGLAGSNDKEIERVAGVPTGSLGSVFGTRERLFHAVLAHDEEVHLSRLRAAVAGGGDPANQLDSLLAVSLDAVHKTLGLMGSSSAVFDELKRAAGHTDVRQVRVLHQMICEVLRRGWHSGQLVLERPESAAATIVTRLMALRHALLSGVRRLGGYDDATLIAELLDGVVRVRVREPAPAADVIAPAS